MQAVSWGLGFTFCADLELVSFGWAWAYGKAERKLVFSPIGMETALSLLLEELLRKHSCVVLPGFGGWVTRRRPARMVGHPPMAYPPTLEVAFNAQLVQQDGLLVHAYAARMRCSFAEAAEAVSAEAKRWKSILDRGETLVVGRLGKLLPQGAEWHWVDMGAPNLLLDAYGWSPFMLVPVAASIQPKVPVVRSLGRRAVRWAAAVALPLALASGWWAWNQSGAQQANVLHSLFSAPAKALYQPSIPNALPVSPTLSEQLAACAPPPVLTASAPESVLPAPSIPLSADEELIVGCFLHKSNADDLLQQLVGKGFPAHLAGQNPAGLWRVSAARVSDQNRVEWKEKVQAHGLSCWAFKGSNS